MLDDYVGFGALSEAMVGLGKMDPKRIFVVASATGWKRFNAQHTQNIFNDKELEIFSHFSENPSYADILVGVERMKAFKPDCIVAYGGGSPIDVAKTVKALVYTKKTFVQEQPESVAISGEGPPLVAIATTSGSGSEATHYSIFYIGEKKLSLSHPSLRPDIAVVDPELTYTLPPPQTASTGFDALSQSIEAYWATSSTDEVKTLADAAIGYILPNIYNAVHAPQPDNRYHMAIAAHLSGKAIDVTRTTLPHALAYHITKRYGLPHGHACALTLPYFFIINTDEALTVNLPGGKEEHRSNMAHLVRKLGQETPHDCFLFLRNLMRHCGLAPTLAEAGIASEDQVRELAYSINPVQAANHPVAVTQEYLYHEFAAKR